MEKDISGFSAKDDILRLEKGMNAGNVRLESSMIDQIARLESSTNDQITRLEKTMNDHTVRLENGILRLQKRINDLSKTIYFVGLSQFMAIVGAVFLKFTFMSK